MRIAEAADATVVDGIAVDLGTKSELAVVGSGVVAVAAAAVGIAPLPALVAAAAEETRTIAVVVAVGVEAGKAVDLVVVEVLESSCRGDGS